ncbi:MAG: flagellar biosynthetic protein FliO [Planctomycetes bacterium]|nr:flagellar biosynthetic protein FliO [Planctomycetota bacterium]
MRARHAIAIIVLIAPAAGGFAAGAERAPAEAPRSTTSGSAPQVGSGADPSAERPILDMTFGEYIAGGQREAAPSPDRPAGVLRILGWTASIAVGFIALALAYRRFVPAGRILAGGKIRILARTQISPRHALSLVRVGNRAFLIGTSGDRIAPIAEFREPAEVMGLSGDFSDELARAGASPPAPGAPSRDALDRFRGEIDRLRDVLHLGRRASRERETVS